MTGRELVRGARADLARRIASTPATREGCGLRFTAPGGPVVAVIGLHGGAGTSTLAYALAAKAAEESPAPVVLCETDASSGDAAYLTGVVSPFGMSELALELEAGRMKSGGAQTGRLRVIAGPPKPACRVSTEAILALVDAARGAHGLTVIDAGTVRCSMALELAGAVSHVVWVTRARKGAAQRARPWLTGVSGRQALAVRGGKSTPRSVGEELRKLAEDSCERLVQIQDSSGVNGHVELGERRMLAALTGLAGFLT